MATKRRPDQSQLDYLWDMFGDLALLDNPLDADDGDILNKKGVTLIVLGMIRKLLKSLELKENEDDTSKYDVITVSNDGDRKTVFQLDKEDHLISVVLRKSLEPDVENGVAGDIGEPVFDFGMLNGNHIVVSLDNIYLEGSKTNSITTWVNDGKIYSKLRLANSDDPVLNVEVIQGGLLIETILAQPSGQVVLEKTTTGLAVNFNWADGKPVQVKDMTWAQYAVEEEKDGVIYFLNDKGYILLNGKHYGEIPKDVVRYTPNPTKENPDRKMILLNKGDAIMSDNGTDKAILIKQNKNGATVVGDSNHPTHVFGSDKFKYNGKEVAFSDDLSKNIEEVKGLIDSLAKESQEAVEGTKTYSKSLVDAEVERVNKVIQTLNSNIATSIQTLNKNVADGFNTINGGIDNEIRPAIAKNASDLAVEVARAKEVEKVINDNLVENVKALNNAIAIVNQNLVDSVNTINGGINDEIRPELEKAVKYDDVSTEQNLDRKAITLENHDLILGKKTDGGAVNLAMVSKWDKADYGSTQLPINLNGSETRPTYNDNKEIALVDDLSDTVKFVDVSTDENPNRKAVVLENHDILLGRSTDGGTYNIAMLSKWDVMDYGSTSKHINLNGSNERPTYNDVKGIALLDDVDSLKEIITSQNEVIESLKQTIASMDERLKSLEQS